jgi:hypothetical protein
MGLRAYILLMSLGTLLAWTAWGVILFNVSPTEAGFAGLLIFYLTLSMALVGSLALIGTFVRIVVLHKHQVPSREIRIAFRHALLFSVVAVITLALSRNDALRTWHVVILIVLASIIEYLYLLGRRGRG